MGLVKYIEKALIGLGSTVNMGRATEFFHFLKQEKLSKEDDLQYTHLTITDELKKLKKDNQVRQKSGLKPKGDGTFSLF